MLAPISVRVFLGFLVTAMAVATAVWIHAGLKAGTSRYDTGVTASGRYVGTEAEQRVKNGTFGSDYAIQPTLMSTTGEKASWQDPVAALIGIAGVGAGFSIVLPAFRRVT